MYLNVYFINQPLSMHQDTVTAVISAFASASLILQPMIFRMSSSNTCELDLSVLVSVTRSGT